MHTPGTRYSLRVSYGFLLLLALAPNGVVADSPTADAPAPPAGWRERFDAVYQLRDDEVVKLVAPPFIPERATYYRYEVTKNPSASLAPVGQFMFWWVGRLQRWSLSSGKGTVSSAVADCGGLERYEVQIDGGLAFRPLEGDWIVRKDAPREKRLTALQDILRRRLGRDIQIERRKAEREVIVVTGEVPRELRAINIYADPNDLRVEPSGGGSGTLDELFKSLGGQLDRKFVNQTTGRPATGRIPWRWHFSASGADRDPDKMKRVLANVSRQMGLTFTPRNDEVEVWMVSDPAEAKTGL